MRKGKGKGKASKQNQIGVGQISRPDAESYSNAIRSSKQGKILNPPDVLASQGNYGDQLLLTYVWSQENCT